LLFADCVYSTTETGTGVNLDKQNYTLTITSKLICRNRCFYPVSGIIEITTDEPEKQTLNYGDGDCDHLVSQNIGGVSTEIKLQNTICIGHQLFRQSMSYFLDNPNNTNKIETIV
jgi:hypothetical protein